MANKINKKILIAEDDKDLLSILKTKFAMEGFSVFTAENGEEGAVVAEREKPDLVISDLLMPKMDGMEMAKKIKESNAGLPIIFLTNIKDPGAGEKTGFDYLIKSDLRINDIIAKVKIKLGLVQAEAPPVPPAPSAPRKEQR